MLGNSRVVVIEQTIRNSQLENVPIGRVINVEEILMVFAWLQQNNLSYYNHPHFLPLNNVKNDDE